MSIKKVLLGGTLRYEWINSGQNFTPFVCVYTGSETLVSSATMASSGNGFFYYNQIFSYQGYMNTQIVGIDTNVTPNRRYAVPQIVKVVKGEVD